MLEADEPSRQAFIIRLRREPREIAGAEALWRGTIEHLPSGTKGAVQNLRGIVAFMAPYIGEPAACTGKPGALRRSIEALRRVLRRPGPIVSE